MVALEMQHVCYRHPRAHRSVLNGVTLACESGSSTLITGAMGAGKSTLIQLLAGLLRPDSGEIRANGDPVSRFVAPHRDRWRRRVGLVFQHLWLIENRTVWDNVMMPLIPLKLTQTVRNQHVDDVLEQLQLGSLRQSVVSTLSGGERQRCAVARSLVTSPTYLFADEPTAHMDDGGVELVMTRFANARQQGATLVVVSHDPRLEHTRFDRRFVLTSGQLEERDKC